VVTLSLARTRHLVMLLRAREFRRLFAVRICSQFADGVFQASLAGAVLFNPERQAHASDIAAGFAVLLLPYSIIGPFAGVLLDRWWRQRVLTVACLLRSVLVLGIAAEIASGMHGEPFYASALVVLSVSRFFLACLSAALPHVIGAEELVTANAVTTTFGALATTAGGGAAIGARLLVGSGANASYAVMAAAALVPYLTAAYAAHGFPRTSLGPDDVERTNRETLTEISRGLIAGARHLRERRPALLALGAIGIQRLCYGLFAVCTLLLYRNYYDAVGPLRTGLAGLAQFVVAVAAGGALAALITPPISRRIGFDSWTAVLLAASGLLQLALVLPYRLALQVLAGFLLGCASQGIKICVDTTVQRTIDDEFRGRVFALYDVLFNLALVTAAVLTALVLPEDGRAPTSVVVIALVYLVTAVGYRRLARRPVRITAAAPTSA
jgi:MFS family permease